MDTLTGLTSSQLMNLIAKNLSTLQPNNCGSLLKLSFLSMRNSIYMRKEKAAFAEKIENTEIKESPLFILGHWRSGTTLLHSLLSKDPQFAFPNMYEVYNPHTFLTTQPLIEEQLKKLPPEKRPMDNMMMSFSDPAEDEFAISLLSLKSPLIGWAIPKQEAYFDRYLTLHHITEEERQEWKRIFVYFLKKLTLKYNRQLLLKSPHHTARVKTLLEIFPDAKFIHLRRNPYDIFRSTVSLYKNTVAKLALQPRNLEDDIKAIITRYKAIYDFFFVEKLKIKENHLIEIAFEDLELDFIGGLEKIYGALNLEGWENYKPILSGFLEKQPKHEKNVHPPVEDKWRKEINKNWASTFEEWGYKIEE